MTDREIIDTIKKDIVEGNTADFLCLYIVDQSNSSELRGKGCFSESFMDEMMTALFDISMTHEIVVVSANHMEDFDHSTKRAFNGNPYPIIGYTFFVRTSQDHQTNITPKLMKFIEVVMRRDMLDRLAFPYGKPRQVELRNYGGVGGFCPIAMPPPDPWDAMEAYLKDEDRSE